jgi:hypothetical protein
MPEYGSYSNLLLNFQDKFCSCQMPDAGTISGTISSNNLAGARSWKLQPPAL